MGLLPDYKQGQPQKSSVELIERITPKPLSANELEVLKGARVRIAEVIMYLNENVQEGRELSLAYTHLEEAMMWSSKAVAV